jgi:hypothetical protein
MILFLFSANFLTISSSSVYKKSKTIFCIAAQFVLSMICRDFADVLNSDTSSSEFNNGGKIADANNATPMTTEDEWLIERHKTFFTQQREEDDEEREGYSLSWSTDAIPDMDDFMDVTHLIPFTPW